MKRTIAGVALAATVAVGMAATRPFWVAPDAAQALVKLSNGSDRSWHFTPVATAGPVQFSSAPGLAALAATDGISGVMQLRADDGTGKGLAVYQIDLSVQQ